MTPRAHSCLISWEPISERLITTRFRSRVRNIKLLHCYDPTEKSSVNDKDDFYNLLAAKVPRGDIILVMGDLNAKVDADRTTLKHVLSNQDIGIRNDNGEKFVDFCNTNHLVIGGTVFQHKPRHKISWISRNVRDQNQIDYFAITRRFRGCLQD